MWIKNSELNEGKRFYKNSLALRSVGNCGGLKHDGRNFDSDDLKQFMNREKQTDSKQENKGLQPDEETLHSTDPQENMQGPVSSPTKNTGDVFDSDEDKRNADEKRDERM